MIPPFSGRTIRTARLLLRPVSWPDLPDMDALKGDPRAYGMMLGGVRRGLRVADEMTQDVALWGRCGCGIFVMRRVVFNSQGAPSVGEFVGMTGVHERPDGRGLGLRFALMPAAQGRGYAREGAAAALTFTHDRGVVRIVAVARESNIASRTILGGIGMHVCGGFERDGNAMLIYESVREPPVRHEAGPRDRRF